MHCLTWVSDTRAGRGSVDEGAGCYSAREGAAEAVARDGSHCSHNGECEAGHARAVKAGHGAAQGAQEEGVGT